MNTTILAIETSCDETAAAVVRNGREVLSNVIHSQIDIHTRYGGVVPEIASRSHITMVDPVIDQALADAGLAFDDIDAIAVTYAPGLVGALLVGVSCAKALAFALEKPLIGVHHIQAHIMANLIAYPDLKPPFLCLVASGGHSHIVWVADYTSFEVLGKTRDDAAGEAFDKIARVLGLGYPGGPKIDALAKEGDASAYAFPRVKPSGNELDFSFSGLKTAVINQIHKFEQNGAAFHKADIAASFQQAVTDVLCDHTMKAARQKGTNRIALAGGVAANSALRSAFQEACGQQGYQLFLPPLSLCTDNAAMVGACGYYQYNAGRLADLTLNAVATKDIGIG